MPTIAHLSDPHLDGGAERLDRLHRVLDELPRLDVDAVLVTGDLADHGLEAEYAQLVAAMPDEVPWLAVPGNHDVRAAARAALGGLDDADGPLDRVLDVAGLRIVALDSLVEGEDWGRLDPRSIELADTAVREAVTPVAIALHHPPVAVGHRLMDGLGLRETDALERLVAHERVTAVLTGHVHSSLAAHFRGTPVLGAGGIVSTMRLGSRTAPIADAGAVPVFALHTFDADGWVRTVFHPLAPAA